MSLATCFVGLEMSSYTGSKFDAYLGIPYAQPPTDLARYLKPKPWKFTENCSVMVTLTERPPCMQYLYRSDYSIFGSEDCLYLNIYKPRGDQHGLVRGNCTLAFYLLEKFEFIFCLQPVLIEFADRDFETGDASPGKMGPELIMATGQIILVTVAVRLGVLGK